MSVAPPGLQPLSYEQYTEASAPYAVLRINGANVYAIDELEVDLNAHGATSSATVHLPIMGNPDFSGAFDSYDSVAATGEIFVGWPSSPPSSPSVSGLTRVYYGLISTCDPDFAANVVTFEMRSLASPLVDQKIQQLAANITTVQFVQSVCAKFGLKFVSQLGNAPITVQEVLAQMFIGGYNFAAAIHGMRIWDLILQSAQFDNADVWEDQGTVYYVAPSLLDRKTLDIKYGRDLSELKCSHSLQFAKDVQVEVRSYQPRVSQSSAVRYVTNADGSIAVTKVSKTTTASPSWGTPTVVSQTITPKGEVINNRTVTGGNYGTTTSLGTESTKLRYIYYLKNASPAACNAFAISRWRQISQQEYTAQMRMPLTKAKGIFPLTALIRLHGVPYAKYNDTFYPRKITLSGGVNHGFEYNIDALNHALPQGSV